MRTACSASLFSSRRRPHVPKLSEKKSNFLIVPSYHLSQASDPLPASFTSSRHLFTYVLRVSPLQRINTLIHHWTDGHPVLLPERCSPLVSAILRGVDEEIFCTARSSLRNVRTSSALTTHALALCCARSLNGDQGSLHHQLLRTATRRLRCPSCYLLPNVLTTVPNV